MEAALAQARAYAARNLEYLMLLLGGAVLLKWVFQLLRGAYRRFRQLKWDGPSALGRWALVTGATDGIGLAYVRELASRGFDVILVSRTASRLSAVSAALRSEFDVETRCFAVDCSRVTPESLEPIARFLQKVEIGLLINNVGTSYEHAEYTHLLSQEFTERILQLNVHSMVAFSRLVLPYMLLQGRGCIVNVGSGAARLPTGDPLYSLYASSKAFVESFSRSMYHEYQGQGISVQCHVPFYVPTKLSKIRQNTLFCPDADTYAYCSVRAIAFGDPFVVPYWSHALQDWFFRMIPPWLLIFVGGSSSPPPRSSSGKRTRTSESAPCGATRRRTENRSPLHFLGRAFSFSPLPVWALLATETTMSGGR